MRRAGNEKQSPHNLQWTCNSIEHLCCPNFRNLRDIGHYRIVLTDKPESINLNHSSHILCMVSQAFLRGLFLLGPLLLLNERPFLGFEQSSLNSLRPFVLVFFPVLTKSRNPDHLYIRICTSFSLVLLTPIFPLLMLMKGIRQHKMPHVVIFCCVL